MKLEAKNPDYSFNSFYDLLTSILDRYAPIKKLSKKEIKSKLKLWITNGIKTSISKCDKILKQFIKAKDNNLKSTLHIQYKTLQE